MNISNLPKGIDQNTAQKILQVLNVFETGTKKGKYDGYVEYEDFTYKGKNYRQITYGKSQTTEFGNLKHLLQMYVDANGVFKKEVKLYISRVGKIINDRPQSFWQDEEFEALLKRTAKEDIIMRNTQDIFFDRYYFQPALAWFVHMGFTLPLSLLVIYDSFIHSGVILSFLRQRFPALPPTAGGKEKDWVSQYIEVRHEWLKNHSKPVVRASKYRTKSLNDLIGSNNWDLKKPFVAHGIQF